jgi:sec-independent protein translocase protein TatA
MFGIGLPELTIILVIVLIIFGAGKLPTFGAGLGKSIRNFKSEVRYPIKLLTNRSRSRSSDSTDSLHFIRSTESLLGLSRWIFCKSYFRLQV